MTETITLNDGNRIPAVGFGISKFLQTVQTIQLLRKP